MPRFSWDEQKRRANLEKHGIDFADVAGAFDGPAIDSPDEEHSHHEDRWRRLLWLRDRVVVVIYTERGDEVRLISARCGTDVEARLYLRELLGEERE